MSDTHSNKEYHIHLSQADIAPFVILPGDPARAAYIATFLQDAEELAFNREYRSFKGFYSEVPVLVMSTGIGCPSAAIAIEELIRCGANTFIRVGTAGGIQPYIGLGDLVISTATVRDEGTSVQYVPPEYPAVADFQVTKALVQAAKNRHHPFHVGITHTKDAFYAEGGVSLPLEEYHAGKWRTLERANVLATSMEAAALFVIGSIRKVRVGEILAVIGLTYKHEPIIRQQGITEAIEIALEALRLLATNETKK